MTKRNYNDWTKEDLIKEVETLKKQKTYGLVWEQDKTEEVFDYYINWDGIRTKEVFKESEKKFPVLRDIKSKEILTDKNSTVNLLIEGDNYHSLATLNFTHNKAIDVIYIDPPYNTGNKDFKYNDCWVELEDSYRHSKWLSFMEKRLKLAKNLLKKDGVIFISINDIEVAQLKILCDEIFVERNLLGIFTWVRKKKGSNLSKELRKITEYILAYKGGGQISLYGQAAYAEKEVPLLNRANNVGMLIFPVNQIRVGSGVGDGVIRKGIFGKGELVVNLLDDIEVKQGMITNQFKIKGRFRWSQETVDEELENGSIFTVSSTFRINVARYNQADKFKSPTTLLTTDDGIGTNEDATEELRNIFPEKEKLPFDYPKPTTLIKYLIASVTRNNKSAIILDFMAGTGTTGHSVLQLNKEDGGNRSFILCTNNENNICTEVCLPRIDRVIGGYKNSKNEEVEGLGGNLKYYKTAFVNATPTDAHKKAIVDQSTEMLCIKEGAFELVMENNGYKIFKNNSVYLGIIFNDESIDDFVNKAKSINGKFNVYVFSLDDTVPNEEFKNIKGKVNLCPIPEVILHVYRRIFKND